MEKYRGKYRVVNEFDRINLEPIKSDMYIFCSHGGQVYRYNNDTLAYYRNGILTKVLLKKLDEAKVQYENMNVGNNETLIYFAETDLDKTVEIFNIRTSGASIAPYSNKNLTLFTWYKDNKDYYNKKGLPKKRELSEEQKQIMADRLTKARELKNNT